LDNTHFYNKLLLGIIFACCVWVPLTLAQGTVGLEAALHATLNNHPALNGKKAEVDAKGYAADGARALRYPSLSTQLSGDDTNANEFSLQARQPLWAFGRIDSAIAYADADMIAENADLLRVKRQLIDQTAVAYVRILGVRQSLKVSIDNTASFEQLYQQIKRRELGQRASLADVKLAMARLLQAQAKKNKLGGDLMVAQNELLALTQSPIDTTLFVPETLKQLPSPTQILALALAQSADVALKTQRITLARADVEREKFSAMPTVYLQADHNDNNNNPLKSGTTISIRIAATVDSLGFAAEGRNKIAGARLQAAMAELYTTNNEVSRLVNSHIAHRDAQNNLVVSQQQSVQALTEILASYQRQYSAGFKSWLDVLNIQRELTEQRLQLVQANNDWLIYTLKLAALTGGLDVLSSSPEKSSREPQ
jgi:adhesin transport system outer membrane protein